MKKIKILTVFGTRPEVIKLAPFIKVVEDDDDCISIACATTQHKELQNDVLNLFNIKVEHDLDVMVEGQDLFHITESILNRIKTVLDLEKPDYTVVQGDTTTAFAAAMSSFYRQIPVVHIEAGLRTGELYHPYPEEANRSLISRIAAMHMAPTERAVTNLAHEGIEKNVFNVGNTIVDAVNWILGKDYAETAMVRDLLQGSQKKILITIHRRENFGDSLKEICSALTLLTKKYSDCCFIWPVHPNPNIKNYVYETMKDISNLKLIKPVSYNELIKLLHACSLILSDSGGIQEEASILGKKIIVLRNETERPEVIDAGFGVLAGADSKNIISNFDNCIKNPSSPNDIKKEIYGKPGVSERILSEIKNLVNRSKNER